jgi:hypothetical protein
MADTPLVEREREVERSRSKLTQDIAVLCSSETFAAFTDDLKREALGTKDVVWEKLKARAASNPAAVMAIGAGLAWRLMRRPPIASALVGLGLYSLWKTQPKTAYDATGRRLDYVEQSKEVLKEQTGQAFSAAADVAGKAQEAAATKGLEAWQSAKEKMREWQGEVGGAVSDTALRLKASGEELLDDVRVKREDLRDDIKAMTARAAAKVQDDETRNTVLLGVAGLAIAAALGIACQKKISETVTD